MPLPFTAAPLTLAPRQLVSLNLSNTHRGCSHFPYEFQQLVHLEDLDLSMNDIGLIPVAIFSLHKLKRLDLSFNRLEYTHLWPSSALQWPDLETLKLTGNLFIKIPKVVCHMKKVCVR